MNQEITEYLKSLKPEKHINGIELVKEGVALGETFEAGRSRFIRESPNYETHMDYKKECMREGKIIWQLLMGLATLEDQVEALKSIYEFTKRTGMELNLVQAIPSGRVALPDEYRENSPETTSYMMDGLEDYQKQTEAAPLDIIFGDYHLSTPDAIRSTINALKVGSPRVGVFCQFLWDYPGFDDDMKRVSDMVIALGVMASKKDEMFAVETYLDDGLPGYFLDCIGYVGYALLEHYICHTLCGARYSVSFGGLLSEGDKRMGIAMAIHELLSTPEQPALSYINSSTNLQWDHDIHGNYGISCQEFLFEILVEKKYRMGMGINPVSITEKLKVATLNELLDIFSAGWRTEEKSEEWVEFFDTTRLEEIRDVMVEQGKMFFENILEGFEEAGIDINDPLELILVMKNINPIRFEQIFHPSTYKKGGEIDPFFPTILAKQTMELRDEIIVELERKELKGSLNGKKILVASGDAHTYGLILIESVLSAAGAIVVNGSVDMDPVDMLDLADEENIRFIGISCHNGQALDYGKQLIKLARERNKGYWFFMGGKLNAILKGESEPVEIDHLLEEMGIHADNDIIKTIELIKDCK